MNLKKSCKILKKKTLNQREIIHPKNCKKLMPLLHLPIQSGSNKILKLMNRKHNREHYISIIEKLKMANKNIKISSDFMVGYPGETTQDFEDTLNLVKKIGFVNSYSFIFSQIGRAHV